jgi:hypothetical protein
MRRRILGAISATLSVAVVLGLATIPIWLPVVMVRLAWSE